MLETAKTSFWGWFTGSSGPAPWDSLGFPNGALISEAFHELHHYHGTSCDDHQII
jgi:hypothetical protein